MNTQDIQTTIEKYLDNEELAGCQLLVRKEGQLVYRQSWGYANRKTGEKITDRSIYRLMSMTKGITAVGIMKLVEEGKIDLDQPIRTYIPEFRSTMVVDDARYVWKGGPPRNIPWLLLTFNKEKVKTKPAEREITVRDLLSHASGMEQGIAGMLAMIRYKGGDSDLEQRIKRYYSQPADFEPGTMESYSPSAGFDILGLIAQRGSGKSFGRFLEEEVYSPLEMTDTTFALSPEQKSRLVRLYERKGKHLKDVTDTKKDLKGFLKMGEPHYEAGCGGLYGTAEDYLHLISMLGDEGLYDGRRFLSEESVSLLHTEAQEKHLEPFPGTTWGLGMLIRQEPELYGTHASKGTYGWSGAFGTHFFISPEDHLQAVFMSNRSDAGGSGFYISKEVENLVFDIFGK